MVALITIVHVLATLGLITSILLQSGRSAGISGTIAGGAESIFGRRRGLDETLSRVSLIIAIVFGITSVVLSIYRV